MKKTPWSRLVQLLSVGVILFLWPKLASATTLVPKTLDDLMREAEIIFTGTVVDVRSQESDDGKTIYTYVTFAEVDTL